MSAASEILEAFAEMQDLHGVPGTYARGASVSDSLTFIQQTRSYDVDNGQGVLQTMTVVDFLAALSDLVSAGFDKPAYGDAVTIAGRKYEVLGQNANLPPFEVTDPYEQIVKIHTLEVAA